MTAEAFVQRDYRVRFDWGLPGATAISDAVAVVALVDVLSFTTTLTVAADAGIEVFPYRWRDESARTFARHHDAALAVGRSLATPGEISLAPGTVRRARGICRLVLPSPNGSTIAHTLHSSGSQVLGVSLRNRSAAAELVAEVLRDDQSASVAVVAAGEHRPDDSLRPAVEDMWGAGAFLSHLAACGVSGFSPEALTAAAAFDGVAASIGEQLQACAGGRELVDAGFDEDVAIAGEVDRSSAVPLLQSDRFFDSREHAAVGGTP